MADPEAQEIPVAVANQARIRYLADHGRQVPVDILYQTSLLEFIVLANGGPEALAEARAFHEARIAPLLDQAAGHVAEAEEERRSAQARSILLGGPR